MNLVRPADAADIPELASLMTEFYAEAGLVLERAAAEATFRSLIDAPDRGQVWLLESDRNSAGFVVLTVAFSMEYGGLRGFVDDFFVREAFRRRGLGAAALTEVRRSCAARGVRALLVETGPSNDGALRVYRSAGFVDTGHLLLAMPLAKPVHAV
jgi:ribosomal protein S18 acetylase RimI-like enzyme